MFGDRQECFLQGIQLIRTDIIPLVMSCWPKAFANVQNNLTAIRERGWYPYTRILLLHYILRATMTEEMIKWEKNCGLFGKKLITDLHDIHYEERYGDIKMNCKLQSVPNETNIIFHNGITAQYVSTTILTESDRQIARQRSQKKRRRELL